MNKKSNNTYGYARVSTKDQHEGRQILALTACGITKQNIFLDKQSGKDFNRPAYQQLTKRIRPGDTLFIKSIDRLGRNYDANVKHKLKKARLFSKNS